MTNYSEHADCYPYGHPRGNPCGPNCPYAKPMPRTRPPLGGVLRVDGKHKGPYKEGR